jgi:hypothetical protein
MFESPKIVVRPIRGIVNLRHVGGAPRGVGDPLQRNRERLRGRSNAKSRAAHADFGFDMREAEFGKESQLRRPLVEAVAWNDISGSTRSMSQQVRQQRDAKISPVPILRPSDETLVQASRGTGPIVGSVAVARSLRTTRSPASASWSGRTKTSSFELAHKI